MRRRILLGVCLLLSTMAVAATPQTPTPAPSDPVADNKAVVQRYVSEILSANHMDKLDELVAADFVDSTPGLASKETGPVVVRHAQERIRGLFPSVEYVIDDLIGEGDKVVARYKVNAATLAGQEVHITGMTIFRLSGGKIRETWIINDQIELYRQLGFTIQPPEEKPAGP
jgi:predicted ester cyclase